MRKLFLVALVIATAGCARDEPPQQPIDRVRSVCPTDDHLRDMAIQVSTATYRNAPGSSRACPCPEDTFERNGQRVSCSGPGAIKPASWVMCQRSDVPASLLAQMKAKLPPRCT